MGLNEKYAEHPNMKSMDFIGGLGCWLAINTLFSLFLFIMFVIVFVFFYPSLPGKGWLKGLYFGIIISFIKNLPEAFDQWIVIVYPYELILAQLINTTISIIFIGIIMQIIFTKSKAIEEIHP